MSVVLVNPPALEKVSARIITPPLGLAYLGASLCAQGIETHIIDADALDLSLEGTVQAVRNLNPRIVGVGSMTPIADAAYRLLELLRPEVDWLVLGGAHASSLGVLVFDESPVRLDAVVCGEAEEVLVELVKRILSGKPIDEPLIAGVLLPGKKPETDEWPKISDLDRLPFPDREALSPDKYRHPLFGGRVVTAMITSRGCPYRCIFCDKHVCGSRWRPRSAENVLAEMETIVLKNRISAIIIYDDLFTLDRDRVIEICKGIIERGLKFKWKCEGRVGRVDPEMLSWMKRAGCEMIAYGVETATAKGLAFIHKDITVEGVREAFNMTRDAGIRTLGYFLLGIPGETIEDEMETVRLAVSLQADYAQFGVLSPFRGTELYEYAMEKGWVHELPARGPAESGSRRPVILDGYWTLSRLDRMTRIAHRAFYFRPGYLVRKLLSVRSAGELIAGARQGIKLAAWWARSGEKNNRSALPD